MEKKKYNQMGFDFGDSDAAQDPPAAGFRIKAMKPALKADQEESRQEITDQLHEEEASDMNGQANDAVMKEVQHITGQAVADTFFGKEAGQMPEEDPGNDSIEVANTPVTAATEEPEASLSPVISEDNTGSKPEISLLPVTAQEPAPVQQPAKPASSRTLMPPAQVYAVEGPEPEKPAPALQQHQGFTPPAKLIAEKAEEPEATYNTALQEPAATEHSQPVQSLAAPDKEMVSATLKETNAADWQPIQLQEATETSFSAPELNAASSLPAPAEDEPFHEEINGHPEETSTAHEISEQPKKSTRGRKSLKTLDAEAGLVSIPDDSTLFRRQYYSIGEVAGMFGVNQSLLRFWENEFDIIQPRKNRKGDRHFRPVDIKNLELIYDLLRRRKLTIEGAKEFLKKNRQARERFEMIQSLQQIRGFLLEIKASL